MEDWAAEMCIRDSDPTQRKPDIRLAKEKLGWKPHITLEKGLEKTIAYFRRFFLSGRTQDGDCRFITGGFYSQNGKGFRHGGRTGRGG